MKSGRTLERLREAEALAERLNDDRRRGRVCAFLTNAHSLLGELDEALVTGTRALEIAGRLGDLRLRILTTIYLEQAHYYRGDYERVVELATDNLAALPADWSTSISELAHRHRSTIATGWSGASPSSADSLRRPSTRPRRSGSPSRRIMRTPSVRPTSPRAGFTSTRVTGRRRAH